MTKLLQKPLASAPILFLYFVGNGEAGVFAARADFDTWTFTELAAPNQPLITPKVGPDKLMRDPSVARGPDGTFHMVWTSGWWDKSIGYASTKDFIHWSEQRWLPVMEPEKDALNAWAPEIRYIEADKTFIIYWSSTIRGKFTSTNRADGDKAPDGTPLNHRPYCTTTDDFQAFSPTRLMWDPGFNCIDPTIVKVKDGWLMVAKDETKAPKPAKNLFAAFAKSPTGPWKITERHVTEGAWAEGPMIVQSRNIHVLFDLYMDGKWGSAELGQGHDSWHPGPAPKMPVGARHGCFIDAGSAEGALARHIRALAAARKV